ncbi:hypothetical protein [Microcystis aeruginosa]|uniref:hypothetical protein n=1 Tax=Microcystis aeruginosa TaxID=1126 RepID=UPI0023312CE4|nr:hypothetical protein [Microcystis aeruginosa]MDB9431676.1 hypothetical protein [Microcystis aeruginosa CS-552/01]
MAICQGGNYAFLLFSSIFCPAIYHSILLTVLDNLPDPDVLALEIMENLEAGLESFRTIVDSLEVTET